MDFEEFLSQIGGKRLSPLAFHLLEEPILLTDKLRSRYSAFALAWTGNSGCDSYVYALCIKPVVGKYELAVVRQFDFPSVGDPWYYDRRFFFRDWVQEWLCGHFSDLVNGAIKASKIDWNQKES